MAVSQIRQTGLSFQGQFLPMQTITFGGFQPLGCPEPTAGGGACQVSMSHIKGDFGPCIPTQNRSKLVKMIFSESDRRTFRTFGVSMDLFSVRFEAFLGRFERPYVPKSLTGELVGDPKWVQSGFEIHFASCALGSI
uniref:Uncharacterized protein n=1 Tax=Eutreptiella gymnastica TaxID=73025 RepID=A0A7S1NM97_9EUGL|mmetsp:Transcript_60776/g.108466  ORF Transcript_60776/g.108466 Transcript_60776/m.108466 type:complete len:137 (+) Transcript_60776:107-517(+)